MSDAQQESTAPEITQGSGVDEHISTDKTEHNATEEAKNDDPMSLDDGQTRAAATQSPSDNVYNESAGDKGKQKADEEQEESQEQPEDSESAPEDESASESENSEESSPPVKGPPEGTADYLLVLSKEMFKKAHELMQKAPRETLRIARSGDLETLQAVAADLSADASLLPPHLAGYACDVVCHHLRQSVPPVDEDDGGAYFEEQRERDAENERLAMVALYALLCLIQTHKSSDVLDTVRSSWRNIVRWIMFFKAKHVDRDALNSGSIGNTITGLLYWIMLLDKSLKTLICMDFAMMKLVASLWKMDKYVADEEGFASRCLAVLIEHSSYTAKIVQDLVIQLCHCVPDVVSSRLIEDRLARAYTLNLLDGCASLLVAFCSESCQVMEITLLRDQAVVEVCLTLTRKLSEMSRHSEENRGLACTAICKLVTFVLKTVDGILGRLALSQAIAYDFLGSLAQLCLLLDERRYPAWRRSVFKFLSRTLPRRLPQFMKLNYYVEAMHDALSPAIRPRIMSSTFSKEWESLEVLVRERAAYLIFYAKREDIGKLPDFCTNPECDKDDKDTTFKLCASCRIAKYCSVECQRTHWKGGHKADCKDKQAPKSKDTDKIEEEQKEHFSFYCARRDVLRHLPGIRKLAQEKLPDTPFSLVGVSIDYTVLPRVFEVFDLEKLLSAAMLERDRNMVDYLYRIHRLAKKGREDTILTRLVLPEASDKIKFKHIEVLISNADSFNVQRPIFGEKVPRLTGHDSEGRALDAVEYDRVDAFFASLNPGAAKLDDNALSQVMEKLQKILGDEDKPKVTEARKPVPIPNVDKPPSTSFTFSVPT